MLFYIIKLLIFFPLLIGLIWGSLWLWKKLAAKLPAGGHGLGPVSQLLGARPWAADDQQIQIIESRMVGAQSRLLVVTFAGKTLLIGASRAGFSLLASSAEADVDDD